MRAIVGDCGGCITEPREDQGTDADNCGDERWRGARTRGILDRDQRDPSSPWKEGIGGLNDRALEGRERRTGNQV